MSDAADVFIHETAIIDDDAAIGSGTRVWVNAQIREGARIGEGCIISKDVYVDHGVGIGDRCKIQNGVSIYNGVTLEDDVFVGPNAVFTNDLYPRAFNASWETVPTMVRRGASIGANATIVCGVTLGEYCMVGAGSVVTGDVPPYALVAGNPARIIGAVDKQGRRTAVASGDHDAAALTKRTK
ncbi:N-acetyltransferase [Oceanidesulfovibrio indonesiensis]|uniref:N-acetyltransferase n=1 Tax=Oceanidesulfovibrio indonesiensis TaxID=54767 RepID=A0A7M3MGJ8_9BACT|nr:acyltransferase [Oceanidesulfovibrio indonesiensis]TVM18443.1 N-acetyltransferase [Oceanidesulfovibrio indonesiensis]